MRQELRWPPLPQPWVFQVRVELTRSQPPIWCRLRLRSDLTLDVVHRALQISFEWLDYHLWRFSLGGAPLDGRAGQSFLCPWDVEEGEEADEGLPAASDVRLDEVLRAPGDVLFYLSDYGGNWNLTLRLEDLSDEVQYRAVITALHRATQKNLPITMAAAGLPQIPRLTGEARSYAERLFSFPVIANLSEADATSALVEPARQQQIEYAPDALALALSWTEGYPFYIQQLGKHAWNIADSSPIAAGVVRDAMPAAQAALDASVYEVRVQRATDQERRYMRAMAELGAGPYRSGEVASKLGRKTSEISVIRQRLLDKGLIYATEDYGHVDFTVPRFGEFMARYLPCRAPRTPRRSPPKT